MHKIIISTFILSSLLFSESSYTFVGAKTSLINYDEVTAPAIGLKYGIQKGMWRSTLNLDYSKSAHDTLTSLTFQADKGIFKKTVKDIPFKPHAGFVLGLVQNKQDKGYGIGLNTGVTYLLNETMDLDLSYRYLAITKVKNFKSLNSLTLSLHYFY